MTSYISFPIYSYMMYICTCCNLKSDVYPNVKVVCFVSFSSTENMVGISRQNLWFWLSVICRKSAAAAAAATARKAPMAKSWQRSSPPPPPYCNDYICKSESESVRCEINVKINWNGKQWTKADISQVLRRQVRRGVKRIISKSPSGKLCLNKKKTI